MGGGGSKFFRMHNASSASVPPLAALLLPPVQYHDLPVFQVKMGEGGANFTKRKKLPKREMREVLNNLPGHFSEKISFL